jgi:NADPH2:quinone reductase
MRAVGVHHFGDAGALELLEVEEPDPGPGEVRVALDYAGVNFIDVYMRSGAYRKSDTYQTPLPMVIGMEGAGTVDVIGDDVTGLSVGDRVAYCIHRGSYAEKAIVPAWKLVPVPDEVPLDVATALQLQGCTAHYLSHSAFALQPGQRCLIHAGAGGVGQLLVQLAKACGAEVIVTVGSEDKAELARRRGADHAILYRKEDFQARVMEITGAEGVDVVYDSVGRDTIEHSIRCLKTRGLVINYGGSSGLVEAVSPLALAEAGSVFFTRPHLADYMRHEGEIRSRTDDLFGLYQTGRLEVAIDKVLPLQSAAEAHRLIEGRETRGKLLLEVS